MEEIFCDLTPFLPQNIWNAPHFLGESTPERLLDTHFRLLRADLINPFILSLRKFVETIEVAPTQIPKCGGPFVPSKQHGASEARLKVFRDIQLHEIDPHARKGKKKRKKQIIQTVFQNF